MRQLRCRKYLEKIIKDYKMEKLDQVALNNIAIGLDIPELLSLCETNKKFSRLICSQDYIWNYNLNKFFSNEIQNDFKEMRKTISPKELFKLLFSLKKLKQIFNNVNLNLLEVYNLEIIDLFNTQLKQIPKEIENLVKLQILDLSFNQIKQIPKELCNITNLKVLRLNNNQIKEIPKELGNLSNLEVLSLSFNQIKYIPKELSYLTKLTDLFIDNNQIEEIPDDLENLSKLKRLILHNNPIAKIPVRLKKISSLPNKPSLHF